MADGEAGDGAPIEGASEVTGFVTYVGDGFAAVRAAPEKGQHGPPMPVSNRRLLRDGLPGIYRDEDFSMRFVAAFERVLDPIVGLLDALPAHFDPDLAPLDVLDLTTKWLGITHNEAQPAAQLRELVRAAADLARRRGTHAGVRLALELNFPDLPLRIEDAGSIQWSQDGQFAQSPPPSFVVLCDAPITTDEAAAVARVIEAVKPAHVAFRLRIKGPRRDTGGSPPQA